MSANPTTPPAPPPIDDAKTPGIDASNRQTDDLPRCERCAAISYLESWERVAERLRQRKTTTRKLPKLTSKNRERFIAAVTEGLATGTIEPASARALLYAAQLVPAAPKRQ
jgi:hypothetical protein